LAQVYTDWEAIIVDDGSTDNTREIAAQLTDPRVRYIFQENRGLSGARNTGIRHSSGRYLNFLDADDILEPEFVQRCVSYLADHPTLGGVYTRNSYIDDQGTLLPRAGGEIVSPEAFHIRVLEGGFFPCHAMLLRRDAVLEAGSFDTELTSLEDWDLWLRLSRQLRFHGIDACLVRYRVHPGSMSSNAARMHANRLAVVAKYFGPPDSPVATWSEEKRRAYGFALRGSARNYIEQQHVDEGWKLLGEAIIYWPRLLERLDTFYELALGDQSKGYRGKADQVDLDRSGPELFDRLVALLDSADATVRTLRSSALGTAHLSLAMLNDQAGNWAEARKHLVRAISFRPRFLSDTRTIRRLLKLCIGKRAVEMLRPREPDDHLDVRRGG